jgi:hypothetical protein
MTVARTRAFAIPPPIGKKPEEGFSLDHPTGALGNHERDRF